MDVRCQCGSVSFRTATPKPSAVFVCHCLECRKQSASAFGISAFFPTQGIFPLSLDLANKLGTWTRIGEESGGQSKAYFCKICGVRIMHHLTLKDGTQRPTVAVKGGCVEGLESFMSTAKHIYTRSAVVDVPGGAESCEGPP